MKMTNRHAWVLSLAAAMSAAGLLPADIVRLTDGTELEGRVERVLGDDSRIAFISSVSRIEFPTSRIAEIIEESDAQDWTRVGNQFLKSKNFSSAVQHYQKALEADPEHAEAREGLAAAQGAISSMQEERRAEREQKLASELENIPAMIADERFTEAETLLNQVISTASDDKVRLSAQRLMRDLYLEWGFSRYDRLDFAGAEDKYTKVRQMDPENKEALEKLLVIWRNDPTKKAFVLEAYQQKLREDPNNLEFNQLVGDLLYEFQRYGEAVAPLEKVATAPRMQGQGYDTKLRTAYLQAVNDLVVDDKYDEAIALFKRMLTTFPNEDRTRLIVLEYERARRQIAADDWDGRAMLVRKLVQAGLVQYAVREAELILRYDPENETAQQILREQAEVELSDVDAAFKGGNFYLARDQALAFIDRHGKYPDLIEQAEELMNKADIEGKRQQKAQAEQAREIAQRGLQYYDEAVRYTSLMTSRDTDNTSISYKSSAINAVRRAITHYETAIKMDPSLGGITGMDLSSRLIEARSLYNSLTDRPSYVPRSRNR